MRHALSMALQDFAGAMMIVSHDRHLLRTVTDDLLLVADGLVKPFDGDLDDYRQWINNQDKTTVRSTDTAAAAPSLNKKQQRQSAAQLRQQRQPIKNKIQKLEKQIDVLQTKKTLLQSQLSDSQIYNPENQTKLNQLLQDQKHLEQQLSQAESEWLSANEELEAMDPD